MTDRNWQQCGNGTRVSTCFHTPRCGPMRPGQRPGEQPFGRWLECCENCERVTSDLADAIVGAAVAAHPGNPEAIAANALGVVDLILGPAGPAGHYHDPAGRYDYCTDPRCPRAAGPRGLKSPEQMTPAEVERHIRGEQIYW